MKVLIGIGFLFPMLAAAANGATLTHYSCRQHCGLTPSTLDAVSAEGASEYEVQNILTELCVDWLGKELQGDSVCNENARQVADDVYERCSAGEGREECYGRARCYYLPPNARGVGSGGAVIRNASSFSEAGEWALNEASSAVPANAVRSMCNAIDY